MHVSVSRFRRIGTGGLLITCDMIEGSLAGKHGLAQLATIACESNAFASFPGKEEICLTAI